MSEGPSPARARATARDVASYTATTSVPSTFSPGIPYAAALLAKSVRDCSRSGVPSRYVCEPAVTGQTPSICLGEGTP